MRSNLVQYLCPIFVAAHPTPDRPRLQPNLRSGTASASGNKSSASSLRAASHKNHGLKLKRRLPVQFRDEGRKSNSLAREREHHLI